MRKPNCELESLRDQPDHLTIRTNLERATIPMSGTSSQPRRNKAATPIFGDPKSPFASPPGSYTSFSIDSSKQNTIAPFDALAFFRKLGGKLSSDGGEASSHHAQDEQLKEMEAPCAVVELKVKDLAHKSKHLHLLDDSTTQEAPPAQMTKADVKRQATPKPKVPLREESRRKSRIELVDPRSSCDLPDLPWDTTHAAKHDINTPSDSATESRQLESEPYHRTYDSVCTLRDTSSGKPKQKSKLSPDAPCFQLPPRASDSDSHSTATNDKNGCMETDFEALRHDQQPFHFVPHRVRYDRLMSAQAQNQLGPILQTWARGSPASNVHPQLVRSDAVGTQSAYIQPYQSQIHRGGIPGTSGFVYCHAPAVIGAQYFLHAAIQEARRVLATEISPPFASIEGFHAIRNTGYPRGLLESFRSHGRGAFRLKDIFGHLVFFGQDQQGSRFIQLELEMGSPQEYCAAFGEIIPECMILANHVFGNYVVQKLLEKGTLAHASMLAEQFRGHVLELSLDMYGCRVIQKALEVLDLHGKMELAQELDGHVWSCLGDQNGNHVVQKCIQCIPSTLTPFIIDAFLFQVRPLATHPYGCRVIQRVLENCNDSAKRRIVAEQILHNTEVLAQDQYGNYVVQHLVEHGAPHERQCVMHRLKMDMATFSTHKFASNVVEKCLAVGTEYEVSMLLKGMLPEGNNEPIHHIMKDQYGNYVVQKLLEVCNDAQRETLLSCMHSHLEDLKRVTFGKHILARVEKLLAAGNRLCASHDHASGANRTNGVPFG